MRSDQKPSARYLPWADRPTRHAQRRETESQTGPLPHLLRDVEQTQPRPSHRIGDAVERDSHEDIDLRPAAFIDLQSVSPPAFAPQPHSEPTPGREVYTERPLVSGSVPCEGFYVRRLKPVVDRLVAAFLLVLLSPLIVLIAIGLLFTLRRPILFRQIRVGRNGVPFVLWKFRTMRPDRRVRDMPVAAERRVCHKSPDDPRHTRFGRALRCTRLDELPQLANVLIGDMSLVGPRPELTEIVARYEPWQHDRHLVRPGLTGLWQVSVVDEGMMHEHTDIDLEYIRAMDLRTDLRILLRTPVALVLRRGS
jgi:lipopolysaccharide/colanic/teichoic acid biosynthesis glycosyltransferase